MLLSVTYPYVYKYMETALTTRCVMTCPPDQSACSDQSCTWVICVNQGGETLSINIYLQIHIRTVGTHLTHLKDGMMKHLIPQN